LYHDHPGKDEKRDGQQGEGVDPPEDLLLRDGFYHACAQAMNDLAGKISGIAVVVGHPHERDGKRYNAASLLRDGVIAATYLKHELPNYSVFDEERYFDPGREPCVFEIEGIRFALNICADVWESKTAHRARDAGAQVLLVLNASPYAIDKQEARYHVIRERSCGNRHGGGLCQHGGRPG